MSIKCNSTAAMATTHWLAAAAMTCSSAEQVTTRCKATQEATSCTVATGQMCYKEVTAPTRSTAKPATTPFAATPGEISSAAERATTGSKPVRTSSAISCTAT